MDGARGPAFGYTVAIVALAILLLPSAVYVRMHPSSVTRIVPRAGRIGEPKEPVCAMEWASEPYALRSSTVVTPDGVRPALVTVAGGKITGVLEYDAETRLQVQDVGNLTIMPGLIDPHVHVNEPGKSHWEGFNSATAAAAAGGTTMLLDMPLNSVPSTVNEEALSAKIDAIRGAELRCDVGLIAGAVPGNTKNLEPLARAGVFAFKSFMIYSGVPEFAAVTTADMVLAMSAIANLPTDPVAYILHAELPSDRADECEGEDDDFAKFLCSRPDDMEVRAIREVVTGARATGCSVHIAHVSSADAASLVASARTDTSVDVSAETCPHYLFFSAEGVPRGNTLRKCAPPIRSDANRIRLWQHLQEGAMDLVASDHSPCPPELRLLDEGNFMKAWGGIHGLQYRLPATWSAMAAFDPKLETLVKLLSSSAADRFGLGATKGRIAAGYDADLVIWDPEEEFTVRPEDCFHRHKESAYDHETMKGRVHQTIVHGETVYADGELKEPSPGRLLLRPFGPGSAAKPAIRDRVCV